ncbi:MAG: serine/threonine-protein kinase [Planctomycetota bacterium]|nr:serine/threonine-protein kinase [Planctomycetota bacterium]
MTPEQFQRIDELFAQVNDLSADERTALLDRECADDVIVREEVEALVAHDRQPHEALKTPVADVRLEIGDLEDDSSFNAQQPDRIGPYEIIDVLGMGGMGVVYRARQSNPRRTVALKVLRPGLVTETILKRFDLEAQVLGRLHHPCVARIYEASTTSTPTGTQPFFAMEFIEGEPITRFVERKRLGTRERLELMLKICSGVGHAHQRGVIHRDLKPGNILVDETGNPSILDFGVARIIDSDFQTTMRTDVGQLIGTIPYMSPEQIEGDPRAIDTRVDVYALGVLLFEMLTKQLPLDVREKSIPEAVRIIRDVDPNRLSSINRVFRGDLETIVGKALEKDPVRRYQSVEEFAGDIQRYLHDEPIIARSATTMYQLRKFAKRNRAIVGGLAAVLIVLVAGVIVSGSLAMREASAKRTAIAAAIRADEARADAVSAQLAESEQRERAEQEATIAKAVSTYLQDTFSAPDPWSEGPSETIRRDVRVVDVLDDAVAGLDEAFPDQPEVEAMLRQVLGRTFASLGRYEEGNALLDRAYEIRSTLPESDPALQLEVRSVQAELALIRGRYEDAQRMYTKLIEQYESMHGPTYVETIKSRRGLAESLMMLDELEESERLLLDLVELEPGTLPPVDQGSVLSTLSRLYHRLGNNEETERFSRESIDIFTRELGAEHPTTLISIDNLINLLLQMERLDEAAEMLALTHEAKKRVLGDEHPETMRTLTHLGSLNHRRGFDDEALAILESHLENCRRVLGDDHPDTLTVMNNLAAIYKATGRYEQALDLFKEAWERHVIVLGEEHTETLSVLSNYGLALLKLRRYEEAEPLILEAMEGNRAAFGDAHPGTLTCLDNLAVVYVRLNRLEEAEPMFAKAYRLKKEAFGPQHSSTMVSLSNLAYINSALGRHKEAMKLNQQALKTRLEVFGELHPDTLFSIHNTGLVHIELGEYEDAIRMFTQAYENRRQVLGADHPNTITSLISLATSYNRSGDVEGALRQTTIAVEVGRQSLTSEHWRLGDILMRHGSYLLKVERYDEAEPVLLEAKDILVATLGDSSPPAQMNYGSIVTLYEKMNREEDASTYRKLLNSK